MNNGIQLQGNFDANQVAPAQPGMTVYPPGWYTVRIIEQELKSAKEKPQNQFLELKYEILDGEQAGRHIFDRWNLVNDDPTAVRIGYATMSSVCRVTGQFQIQHTAQLNGHPFRIKLRVQPPETGRDGKEYPAKNRIVEYGNMQGLGPDGKPSSAADPVTSGPSLPSGGPSLPAAAAAPSWAPQGGGAPAGAPTAPPQPSWSAPGAVPPAAAPAPAAPAPAPAPAAAPAATAPAPAWTPPAGAAPTGTPPWQAGGAPAPAPAAPAVAAPAGAGGTVPPWQR